MLSKRRLRTEGHFDPKCNALQSYVFLSYIVLLNGKKKHQKNTHTKRPSHCRIGCTVALAAVDMTAPPLQSNHLGLEHKPGLWDCGLEDSPGVVRV